MKKKDQLSPFFAEELLYDHLRNELPDYRSQAMKEYLNDNPAVKTRFEQLSRAHSQLKTLRKQKIPETWIEELMLPHPSLAQQLASLEQRFAPRFWRYFPYAIVSLALVFGIVALKPWSWINFKDVEVAQVSLIDDPYLKDHPTEPESLPVVTGKEEAPPQVSVAKVEQKEVTATPVGKETRSVEPAKKTVGVLYRSSLVVDELEVATAQTVEKIRNLGGRKSGQVELGWERDDDERYFHFSLPESNKEALIKFLSGFGPVRISSQDHPLVMPEGKIRIILIVKQKEQVSSPAEPEKESTTQESVDSATQDEEAQ